MDLAAERRFEKQQRVFRREVNSQDFRDAKDSRDARKRAKQRKKEIRREMKKAA